MFSRKKFATLAATAAVALGLVGLGTSAQFSDAVTAQQEISVGTAALAITSAPGGEIASDGKSVTYTLENAGSLFLESHWLDVSNVGTLPMHHVTMSITGSGDPELTDNVTALLYDYEGFGSYGYYAYGTVTALLSRPQPVTATDYTLQPAGTGNHETAPFIIQFYPSDYYDSLPNAAQGKAMTVTVTISAIEGIGSWPWWSDGMSLTADTADGLRAPTPGTELKEPFVP